MSISTAHFAMPAAFGRFELHPQTPLQRFNDTEPAPGKSVTNKLHRLGDIGALGLIGTSTFTLLSPVIPIALKKDLSAATVEKMQSHRLFSQLLDKEKALKLSLRLAGVPGILMYLYNMEIALNTQQPTKVGVTLISLMQGLMSFFIPTSLLQRGFMTATAGLWSAGERNDIENSLHPNHRRELDIRPYLTRIKRHPNTVRSNMPPFSSALTPIFQYISQDLRQTFSIKPWQELFSKRKSELLSTQPASYQSALSAQFFLLTSGLIWTAWLLQHKKAPPNQLIKGLQKVGQGTTLLGTTLAVLPLWMRAWQMRDQTDSKFMLIGGPVMTLGKSLSFADKYLFLSGLNGLGGSFWSRGLASNSRKYVSMLDYLKNLAQESTKHPIFKASDLLQYLKAPENIKALQHNLGKTRSHFILQLLNQAQEAQAKHNTPLADFLAPVIHSYSDEFNFTHSNLINDEAFTTRIH